MSFLRNLRRLPETAIGRRSCSAHENDGGHIARAAPVPCPGRPTDYIRKPFDKESVEAKFQEVGPALGPVGLVFSSSFPLRPFPFAFIRVVLCPRRMSIAYPRALQSQKRALPDPMHHE